MLSDILINTILVSFPLLVYLIYIIYMELNNEKEKNIIFSIALITSLFLCVRYGNIESNDKVLLFCNIPILIAFMKEKEKIAILLSLMTILYCYYVLNYDIFILTIKYFSFAIIYFYLRIFKKNITYFIEIIATLQGFFISFEYFYRFNHQNDILSIVELFACVLGFYIVSFCILYLFEGANKISKLHLTIKELEKDKQIRDSLFKITHEVKNPISVCKGYIDMFDVKDSLKSEKYVRIIKEEINRTLNIMNDFLELRHIKIDREIMDLNLLISETCESMKILTKKKKINIEYKENFEIYMMGDYNRLKQVLVNIIKNSIEAIDKNGYIKIRTIKEDGKYIIEIVDDGIGMNEETIVKVKEMFFTTKCGGSGLGMALSSEIVKAHDGNIEYLSTPNKGTTVLVTLKEA